MRYRKESKNIILKFSTICFFVIVFLLLSSGLESSAQVKNPVIQFSGVVVGEDSTSGVPGVHIYVPKAGRGTTTNRYGYFSMPVLMNDSIVITAIGYGRQHYIVPGDQGESVTVVVELTEDTTYLPTLEIFPYPTEALFKEAILALELPQQLDKDSPNMGEDVLARMFRDMPMDGSMNHSYYMEQQFFQMHNKYSNPYYNNPLLNPINWAKFIKSIKNGDLKRKKNK